MKFETFKKSIARIGKNYTASIEELFENYKESRELWFADTIDGYDDLFAEESEDAHDLMIGFYLSCGYHRKEIQERYKLHNYTQALLDIAHDIEIEAEEEFCICADQEVSAEGFWADLRKRFPEVAQKLENGSCRISSQVWEEVQQIDGFFSDLEYAPTALIVIED